MKQPLELKALGINRELSNLRLWAFRVFAILAIANVAATNYGGTIEFVGAIAGAGIVLGAILYALGSEPAENNETTQEQPTTA